jgi:FkbM family methyltransferase
MIGEIKSLLQRLFRALGWEIRRARNANLESYVLRDILDSTGITIVLDVGANVGQFGDGLLRAGFRGTLVSFEAIPSVHRELVAHALRRSESWVVAPCAALGSRAGKIEINIAGNSVSSSILPMNRTLLDAEPLTQYVDKVMVDVMRLDELAPTLVPSAGTMLIKVDTQGFEMEVLKGATGLLSRTLALQLELSLIPLYAGAPTFVEMVSFVESAGFELYSIVPGFRDKRSGRLLQVDGFFVRQGVD